MRPVEAELGGDAVAVEVPVQSGQGSRASGHVAGRLRDQEEAPSVAQEHPEVGEQVVAEVDGLRALQVRVGGRGPVAVGVGELDKRGHQRLQQGDRAGGVRANQAAPGRSRPGRCASGRCAACRRAGRPAPSAGARSPCGCPRRRRVTGEAAALRARPRRCRGLPWMRLELARRRARRARCSARACARDCSTSNGARRRSKEIEELIRRNSGSWSSPKRDMGGQSRQRIARALAERRADPLDLLLGHRAEERQRERARRDALGDRELAALEAEALAVGRHQCGCRAGRPSTGSPSAASAAITASRSAPPASWTV